MNASPSRWLVPEAAGPPSPGSPRRVAGFLIGRTVAAEIMMIDLVSQVFGGPTPSAEYWVHQCRRRLR